MRLLTSKNRCKTAAAKPNPSSDRSAPCGTALATAFGSDLRSVDTLRGSRFALRQPDDFVAGESRGSALGLGRYSLHLLHQFR